MVSHKFTVKRMNHTHMIMYNTASQDYLGYLEFFSFFLMKDVFTYPYLEDWTDFIDSTFQPLLLIGVPFVTSLNMYVFIYPQLEDLQSRSETEKSPPSGV